jgi:hypothetical protein
MNESESIKWITDNEDEYKWDGLNWINKKTKFPKSYIGFYQDKNINPFIFSDGEFFFGLNITNWYGNFV